MKKSFHRKQNEKKFHRNTTKSKHNVDEIL